MSKTHHDTHKKPTKKNRPKSQFRRLSYLLGGFVLFFLMSLILIFFLFFVSITETRTGQPLETKNAISFQIRSGENLSTIAKNLTDQGLSRHAFLTQIVLQVLKVNPKAGTYRFDLPTRPWFVLQKLKKGEITFSRLTIVEGSTFDQMREKIKQTPEIVASPILDQNEEIIAQFTPIIGGVFIQHPEGIFMPNTYLFNPGNSEVGILKQSHQLLLKQLEDAWQNRAPNLPLKNAYETLILASIIEKETGAEQDRPLIASVFINRLKKGMRLQTDPTVIYGLGKQFDGNLRKKDLQTDTPYNTYTRSGLPPTPISLVSQASLMAATKPANTKYLYFVAKGDGTSHFSETLQEHNQAVNRYQRH
jgi:UPF0755 protein